MYFRVCMAWRQSTRVMRQTLLDRAPIGPTGAAEGQAMTGSEDGAKRLVLWSGHIYAAPANKQQLHEVGGA